MDDSGVYYYEKVAIYAETTPDGVLKHTREITTVQEGNDWLVQRRREQRQRTATRSAGGGSAGLAQPDVNDALMELLIVRSPLRQGDDFKQFKKLGECLDTAVIPFEDLYKTSPVSFLHLYREDEAVYRLDTGLELMFWTYSFVDCTTVGICWVNTAVSINHDSVAEEVISRHLGAAVPYLHPVVRHPLFFVLAAMRSNLKSFDNNVTACYWNIKAAKKRIGYDLDPVRHSSDDQEVEKAALSVTVSAEASSAAACTRSIRERGEILRLAGIENANYLDSREGLRDMAISFEPMRRRLEDKAGSLVQWNEDMMHEASIILQGLFNIIAREDQQLNIEIADQSRILAEEAKRDSTAMKAIAGVTMVFLPGTFVAVSTPYLKMLMFSTPIADGSQSLFAMPLFQWDAGRGEGVVNDRFYIYWAVTVPLTALTVTIWLGFAWFMTRRQRKRQELMDRKRKS